MQHLYGIGKKSALHMNRKKAVFIPLWAKFKEGNLRNLAREFCPASRDIVIDSSGTYLGFVLGSGSNNQSWNEALRQFNGRARQWATLQLGLDLNLAIYNPFISSVLSFVMQLAPDAAELTYSFDFMLRRLALGPACWTSKHGLCNLHVC